MKKKQTDEVWYYHTLFKSFRIMRLTLGLLLILVAQGWATKSYSQKVVLTLNMKNADLIDVLEEIENQTDFYFLFNYEQVHSTNKKVDIKLANKKIDETLDYILKGSGLKYAIMDRQIVISKDGSDKLSNFTQLSVQQKININGKITDSSGQPLPGVTVVVKGTTNGTITDFNGIYTLPNVPSDATLVFSFVGMRAQEILVVGKSSINVVMEEETIGLEEVVAVGYGVQKKSDITGAVSSVSSDELTKIATSSPAQALQGRAAGVSVIQESGSPDASASIRIRGIGTTNNTTPLFVVDGLPMADIDYLNSSDIESIEILKDASACAIYGSRGANGVVIVSTKKGESGALKVDINAYYGVESIPVSTSMLNSNQYAQLSNEAYTNAGLDPIYSNTNNLANNTDWYDEVSRLGTIENYNISFSGGGSRIHSLLSGNYYKRKGIIKSTDFEKLSFIQNTTMEATNFLDIETSLSGVFSNYHRLDPTSIFLSSLIAPPDISVVNPETDYYTGISKIRLANPVGRIARNNDEYKRTYLIGNINATLAITDDLSFKSSFGIRYQQGYDNGFSPVYYETADISETYNTVSRSASKMTDWTWENILTYHKLFNEVHDLTVMGAISAREYNYDDFTANKQNIPIEDEEYWYLGSATENPQADGTGASLSMLSYLGRINYNFNNRYLVTASIRGDGSSRFTESNRWGVFPSGALAWKISEENFFKNMNVNFIKSAKVRMGYGEIGNENIESYYPYLTPISQKQYYTLGSGQSRINGAGPTALGNSDVKWETSTQSNFGIDLLFLDGKISTAADYYIRKTDDILLSQQVPTVSGSDEIVRNVGGIENKGFEFSVTYKESKKPFSYNISANLATVKNKVTNLGTSGALISSFDYDYVLIDFQGALGSMIRSEVGEPYGQFYGWQTDGIFQNQAEIDQYTHNGDKIQPSALPGDFRFKDNNGDGIIDDDDKAFIGNPIPDITFGLSFDAYYKNFDLSLLLQGQAGNDIYNAAKYYFMRFDGRHNVRTDYITDYWVGENTSNSQPAVTNAVARNDRNYRNSDYYIEDGSYIRLKTFQLGYTFQPKLSNEMNPKCRVYVAAQNLFTITKYSGFEPEISGNSVDRGVYPQARTFMLGTVINF